MAQNNKAYLKEYYLKNREKLLARAKLNYDPESKKKYDSEYRRARLQKHNDWSKKYASEHSEQRRITSKKYYENNKLAAFSVAAKRRAAKLNAVPVWLTGEHKKQIRDFYTNKPIGYEVDHIVPLRGKTICGLHVPWNLQYLTTRDNRVKGNKI